MGTKRFVAQSDIKSVQADFFDALKLLDRAYDACGDTERPESLRSGRKLLDTFAFSLSISIHQRFLIEQGYTLDGPGFARVGRDVLDHLGPVVERLGNEHPASPLIATVLLVVAGGVAVLSAGVPYTQIAGMMAHAKTGGPDAN